MHEIANVVIILRCNSNNDILLYLDIDIISNENKTVDRCSYSPGPCDDPDNNCSIPNSDWPSCGEYNYFI